MMLLSQTRICLHLHGAIRAIRTRGKQGVSDRCVRKQAADNSLQATNGEHQVSCHKGMPLFCLTLSDAIALHGHEHDHLRVAVAVPAHIATIVLHYIEAGISVPDLPDHSNLLFAGYTILQQRSWMSWMSKKQLLLLRLEGLERCVKPQKILRIRSTT